jgi:hypothetical protein
MKELTKREKQILAAEAAYEQRIQTARLPRTDPARETYPVAVKAALAAYDAVLKS